MNLAAGEIKYVGEGFQARQTLVFDGFAVHPLFYGVFALWMSMGRWAVCLCPWLSKFRHWLECVHGANWFFYHCLCHSIFITILAIADFTAWIQVYSPCGFGYVTPTIKRLYWSNGAEAVTGRTQMMARVRTMVLTMLSNEDAWWRVTWSC